MKHSLSRGRYTVRLDASDADRVAAQHLRHLCFFGGHGHDVDRFDAYFRHILIENQSGELVATCRFNLVNPELDTRQSYVAQFYDLAPLSSFGRMLELGRFCIKPNTRDADILRISWGALAEVVDQTSAQLLIGCSSFKGTDPSAYFDGFAHLRAKHLGDMALLPKRRARTPFPLPDGEPDPRNAMKQIPPLLRSYLMMGGWVSDHGVIDREMNTLHVFTAVPVAAISRARQRSIRAASA